MQFNKKLKRLKRAKKTRAQIKKLNAVKLVVNKTNQHIYAQVIQPGEYDNVVAVASTLDKEFKNAALGRRGNIESAKHIGTLIAQRAKDKGITKVAFDRSGNIYHGRIKALADAARAAGLEF